MFRGLRRNTDNKFNFTFQRWFSVTLSNTSKWRENRSYSAEKLHIPMSVDEIFWHIQIQGNIHYRKTIRGRSFSVIFSLNGWLIIAFRTGVRPEVLWARTFGGRIRWLKCKTVAGALFTHFTFSSSFRLTQESVGWHWSCDDLLSLFYVHLFGCASKTFRYFRLTYFIVTRNIANVCLRPSGPSPSWEIEFVIFHCPLCKVINGIIAIFILLIFSINSD